MLKIRLDIDKNNKSKIEKHVLKVEDIIVFMNSNPSYIADYVHSVDEPRFIAFGPFENYFMFVCFTHRIIKGRHYLRPISARKAREKEIRKLYENSK